jgi:hypothetical protein
MVAFEGEFAMFEKGIHAGLRRAREDDDGAAGPEPLAGDRPDTGVETFDPSRYLREMPPWGIRDDGVDAPQWHSKLSEVLVRPPKALSTPLSALDVVQPHRLGARLEAGLADDSAPCERIYNETCATQRFDTREGGADLRPKNAAIESPRMSR